MSPWFPGQQRQHRSSRAASNSPSVQPLLRDLRLKSSEPPAVALSAQTPAPPGMRRHWLLGRLPAHDSPTTTVPCSQGFLPGTNAHGDRGLVPAHRIHHAAAAASGPPAPCSLTAMCLGTSLLPAHTHDSVVPPSPEGVALFFGEKTEGSK